MFKDYDQEPTLIHFGTGSGGFLRSSCPLGLTHGFSNSLHNIRWNLGDYLTSKLDVKCTREFAEHFSTQATARDHAAKVMTYKGSANDAARSPIPTCSAILDRSHGGWWGG